MSEFWEFLIHTDEYLLELARNNVNLTYLLLFCIIFSESGNLVFSFLPGDGLLLATGIISASGVLNVWLIILFLIIAAVTGYLLNYATGRYFGDRILSKTRWIRKEHLEKTQNFYNRHGGKAIIIGRFFPVIRTFAPFLAGMTKMNPQVFFKDTVNGGIIWIGSFTLVGYFFGEFPFIQQNFFVLYLGLVVLTLIPFIWGGLLILIKKKKSLFTL